MFEPGSTVGDTDCVAVQIIDDNAIEGDEMLWLSLVESEAVSVTKGQDRATMVIEDNEGSYVFPVVWLIIGSISLSTLNEHLLVFSVSYSFRSQKWPAVS